VTVRVVVVDDQALIRTGLRTILAATEDLNVVGKAANGGEAVDVVTRTLPDLVLMDVRMPGMDGVEATHRLRASAHPPKIVILTTFDLDDYVYSALRAGASGFLLKDTLAADLVTALRTVMSGEAVVAPSVTRRLIAHFIRATPTPPRQPERLNALTSREHEVLTLIALGRSNAEIGRDLHLSESTVKTHVGRVLAKLDLRDRVHAVILAYECGLVPARRHD